MAIPISFTSDAGDVIRDTEKISDGLKDVADELERAGREGKEAGEDIERGLKDGAQGAEKFEDEVRQAMRKAADHADTASKKIGDDTRRGFREAGDGAETFREEAHSTAREAAASFDGSAESIGDAFQEVAANAFEGWGPAGVAAGLAVAAGIGIALKALQDLAEENTEAAERIGDLANEFIELDGNLGNLDIAGRIRAWGTEVLEDNWITFWINEAQTNFEKYGDLADEAGVRTKDAIRGMKGSYEDSQLFLEKTESVMADLEEQVENLTLSQHGNRGAMSEAQQAVIDQHDALKELRGEVQNNIEEHDRAKDHLQVFTDSTDDLTDSTDELSDSTDDLTGKTAEYTEALLENIDALDERAGNFQTTIEAENAWEASVDDAMKTIAENGKTLDSNTKKGRENREALVDMAEAARDKAKADAVAGASTQELNADMATARERFLKAADAAGMGEKAAKELADQLGLVPSEVETTFKTDTGPVYSALREIERQRPEVWVDTHANTTPAEQAIYALNHKSITLRAEIKTYGQGRV